MYVRINESIVMVFIHLYTCFQLARKQSESGPVAALVELWLFLVGFSQPPYQLTSLHCGIFQRTSTAGVQLQFDAAS